LSGVRFRCIYLVGHDFGAFMCEGYDFGVISYLRDDDFGAFMCEG